MEAVASRRGPEGVRSPPGFPWIYAGFPGCFIPSSKGPARPWKPPDLSPKPVPVRIRRGPPCPLLGGLGECPIQLMLRLLADGARDRNPALDVDEAQRCSVRCPHDFPEV